MVNHLCKVLRFVSHEKWIKDDSKQTFTSFFLLQLLIIKKNWRLINYKFYWWHKSLFLHPTTAREWGVTSGLVSRPGCGRCTSPSWARGKALGEWGCNVSWRPAPPSSSCPPTSCNWHQHQGLEYLGDIWEFHWF